MHGKEPKIKKVKIPFSLLLLLWMRWWKDPQYGIPFTWQEYDLKSLDSGCRAIIEFYLFKVSVHPLSDFAFGGCIYRPSLDLFNEVGKQSKDFFNQEDFC